MDTQTNNMTPSTFKTRAAQVAAIQKTILESGKPELHKDSTDLCIHFKRRQGLVGGEKAEAQVYTHNAGRVIRFWVYGADFSVKVRDLILLPVGDKAPEVYLDIDDRIFPHDGKKYDLAGQQILNAISKGR